MKILYLLILSLLTFHAFSQTTDSVKVRVYNKGRFYIKKYTIEIGGKKYVFNDIYKYKYSSYQSLPYIVTLNAVDITIIRKRFLQYDDWMYQTVFPVDEVGEDKISSGKVLIMVSTKRKAGQLVLESDVVKE